MHDGSVFYTIFLIFAGAAFFSTLVLYTKQSLLVAYIILGASFGPWGLKLVSDVTVVKQIGDIGIVFLLFLLGLHLQPQNLIHMLRKVTWIAIVSSILFAALAYGIGRWFGLSVTESMILGGAMMFSSTIIGLKLLPTTILHHQHTGEVMISVLLMQDVIAIVLLILINSAHQDGNLSINDFILVIIALPALCLFSFLFERYILIKLLARFDRTQEYVFLLSIGWCLGISVLAQKIGLSEDIGAFIAGVALASSPISLFIAESLKPLRDFFLVMFFFSIGATFNFGFGAQVVIPAVILATLILIIKPLLFYILLVRSGEKKQVAKEVGIRLGQGSEFSLLVASIALSTNLISEAASNLIQATTILTFIVSSYLVVLKYPTPIALSEKMRKD
ncbi:TPA: cation:proton antiporter [Legionella pneumophila]|nr:cation:proton antiporter [Legionella pneumophila]HAT6979906.1 cation:proton antiporter [Legionella pneumophila]HAU1321601.1 cation:proton antiporter [Legionella pneumophila]HBC0468300.1 cation:proton antiporter [Legionella pneumophila]HBD9375875.1 cation:proton antiporter [Legionella pneumophila]